MEDFVDFQTHNHEKGSSNNALQNIDSSAVSPRSKTHDESQICANCCSQICLSSSSTSMNHQLEATNTNTDFNPILHETELNVIRMMLSEIYNLNYIPHLKISKSSSTSSISVEEYSIDFPLCSSCSTLLADLFNMYSQFNKLRRMDSLLAKEIDVLKFLVKNGENTSHETTDSNQNPGQEESGICMKLRRDIFNQPPSPSTAIESTKTAIESMKTAIESTKTAIESTKTAIESTKAAIESTKTDSNNNNNSSSKKLTFTPNDGPWVRVGRRLEDMAIEEIGYAPPSLCHLYQVPVPSPPEPNLIISNVFSSQSQPQITPDNDDDNDNDLDYEPLPYFEEELVDVKVFTDALVTEGDNVSSQIYSKPTKKTQKKPKKRLRKFTKLPKKKPPPVKIEMVNNSNENDDDDDDGEPPAKKPLKSNKKRKVEKSKTLPLKKLSKSKRKSSSTLQQKPKAKSKAKQTKNEQQAVPTNDDNLTPNADEFVIDLEIEPRVITYDEVVKKKNDEEDEMLLIKSDKRKKTKKRFRPVYERRQMTGLGCPCLYCLEDFATPEERADHVRKLHCLRKKNLCEICGAIFVSKHQLSYHLTKSARKCSARLDGPRETWYMKKKKAMKNTATPEKSKEEERNFPCTVVINEDGDICPYRAQNAVILKNHMTNVHCDPKEKVKCSECDAILKNAHYFKSHFERMHTEKGQKGYQKVQEKAKARKSRQIKEANAKGFICYHCNPPIDFITKARWTIHLTRAHNDYGTKNKITVCELCGKKFKGNYALNKHLQFVHADLRPFVCEHCGLAYKSKTNLDTHISRCHTQEGRDHYNKYNRENYQRKKLIKQQKESGCLLNSGMESFSSSLNASGDDQLPLPATESVESSIQ